MIKMKMIFRPLLSSEFATLGQVHIFQSPENFVQRHLLHRVQDDLVHYVEPLIFFKKLTDE